MRVYLLFLVIATCSPFALAQEGEINHVPSLNGHYFIPASNTQSPFTNSSFAMNLGVAQSDKFSNPLLDIDSIRIAGLQGGLVFANLNIDYQQKIKNWIAFYLNIGLTARIGTELQSIVSQGVNTVTSMRTGWLIHILEGKKDKLSADIEVSSYSANFINLGDFISDVISGVPNASISRKIPVLNGAVGVRYAHAFSTVFGFQGSSSFGYGESYVRGNSTAIYQIGGMVDANLATKTKVPLGFAIFYNLTTRPDLVQVPDKSGTNSGVKISYAGAPHFNLGLELSRIRLPVQNVPTKVNSTLAFISMKYYFN